jgi:hypothetical protein
MRKQLLTVKCYRDTIGDTPIEDVAISESLIKTAKEIAKLHLITVVRDATLPPNSKPLGASLIRSDGRVVTTFKVRTLSAGVFTIEETGAK